MKVLYISTSDIDGGAAIGAYRLHRGFLQNGIESTLLVNKKLSDDFTVIGPQTRFRKALNLFKPYLGKAILSLQKTPNAFLHTINLIPSGLVSRINQSDADLVILHWIGREMLSVEDIGKINKPLVWRLADQWAFCGAEHYALPAQEKRFIEGYTSHNRPDEHKGFDIDRLTWNRKKKYFLRKEMSIVCGSRWLEECARKSYLFRKKRIELIPTGLDTSVYKPINKRVAREILNLPQNKKIILFGAILAISDERKGFQFLVSALNNFMKISDVEVIALIFGASEPQKPTRFGMPTYYLSTLHDDWSLAVCYSAADVTLVPSLLEAFGQTASESMSCGTPVVAFDATGLKDIVDHKENGYLAKPFQAEDLANGLKFILENDEMRLDMSKQCRKKALQEYSVDVQVSRYLNLFHDLVK